MVVTFANTIANEELSTVGMSNIIKRFASAKATKVSS